MKILVLNAGSSSQKSTLYELSDRPQAEHPSKPLWEASVDWTHHAGFAEIKVKTAEGLVLQEELGQMTRPQVIAHLLDTLWQGKTKVIEHLSEIQAVGHRVVHGGQHYQTSVVVTPEVKQAIADLIALAPVHNPANLEGIETIEQLLPTVPQVAVFDTAFHTQMPPAAAIYPGPYEWVGQGIRKYGFHGISHQYCAQRAAQIVGRDSKSLRIISCHLGNGCSLAAIRDGHSVDTTMGFTPLEGLMMGSRSGSIDPGILIHLLRHQGLSADDLDRILNRESGLRGVSGVSADMRQVTDAIAQGNTQAQLAFDMYVHRLRSNVGAMLAALAGLDVLIFTAGVGENQADVRSLTCQTFGFLGLKLDEAKNRSSSVDVDIATPDSTVRVVVVHTQEEWAIAQECGRLLGKLQN